MKALIFPSKVSGVISAPTSKSYMQRACALSLICGGTTTICNPGISMDDKTSLDVIKNLGANIFHKTTNELLITSRGIKPPTDVINFNESGLSLRMFTPIIALLKDNIKLTGKGSLVNRPMTFFDEILPLLNVKIKSNNGKLPLEIKGPLIPSNIDIDGHLSSQFLTGLILSFIVAEKKLDIEIKVRNLKSKPYIDLTLDIIKQFGIEIFHDDYKTFYFNPNQKLNLINKYVVEGDWSGAAFLLVAAAIGGSIRVKNLSINSKQGDKKIIEALNACGAFVSIGKDDFFVKKNELNCFDFDATDVPDLFPPLVALASSCLGVSKIKGTSRLKYKESDRAYTLKTEFEKMGYRIELNDDCMLVHGNQNITKNEVEVFSHNDHRIAMSLAISNLVNENILTINKADSVNKSYPNFFDDISSIGIKNNYY